MGIWKWFRYSWLSEQSCQMLVNSLRFNGRTWSDVIVIFLSSATFDLENDNCLSGILGWQRTYASTVTANIFVVIISDSTAYLFGRDGGLITFTYPKIERTDTRTDRLAFGFVTSQRDGVLVRITSGNSNDYIQIELVRDVSFMHLMQELNLFEKTKTSHGLDSSNDPLMNCIMINFNLKFEEYALL